MSVLFIYSSLIISDSPTSKKLKSDDETTPERVAVPASTIARVKSPETESDSVSDTSHDGNAADSDLSTCRMKNDNSLPLKTTTPPQQSTISPNNCDFMGSALKPYSSQGFGGANDQVYYPHHTSINRSPTSFMPVSSSASSALLQSSSSGLGLHNISHQQMQACRLSGQTSDCALRQPSGHLSSVNHSYGIRTSPPQHPSLPSCTYMQPSQPYPTHLTPNMHMMNFPGSMS